MRQINKLERDHCLNSIDPALSRDGIMPSFFQVTHNGIPVRAVWLTVSTLLFVLLLDYCDLLGIERMLALAGQNFLLLYGLAAAALFTLTKNFSLRLLSVFVVLLVVTILACANVHFLYPTALIMLAWLSNKLSA